MAEGKFVAYYRVSTERQGRSGLGLEAQRKAVADYLNGGSWQLCAEYTEVESGKVNTRPELAKAFDACRLYGATLVIAKMDRLSRDAHFLFGLQKAGIDFVAADMPHADRFTVGIMALVAEKERDMISQRTKAALAAAKARGTKLGSPQNLSNRATGSARGRATIASRASRQAAVIMPEIEAARASGATSLRDIAAALNSRGIPTARGSQWTAVAVKRVLDRQQAPGAA
jgi:DNA invertase Pin-like site-specific DNA recombinase